MDKNIPYELIAKALSGEANQKEYSCFEDWVKNTPDSDVIINEISEISGSAGFSDLEVSVDGALNNVNSKLIDKKRSKMPLVYAMVAGVSILIALSLFLLSGNKKVIYIAQQNKEKYVLPDSSIVYMQRGATISYFNDYNSNNRNVNFKGKAYFYVSKNRKIPFRIYSAGVVTEVLGTKFNFISEKEGYVEISLDEGCVKFKSKIDSLILNDGQAAFYNKDNEDINKKEYSSNSNSWLTGKLIFKNERLDLAIKDIESYYDAEISLDRSLSDTLSLNAEFDNLKIDDVLKSLEFSFGLQVIKDGSKKYVLKAE